MPVPSMDNRSRPVKRLNGERSLSKAFEVRVRYSREFMFRSGPRSVIWLLLRNRFVRVRRASGERSEIRL